MTEYIFIGRRKGDTPILTKRAAVTANTARVGSGVYLEAVPVNARGEAPGIVLVRSDWTKQYLLQKHDDWTEDDYFNRAEFLMKKAGIVAP